MMSLGKTFAALSILLLASRAQAQVFRGAQVCMPKVDPQKSNLEFEIRDGGACAQDDLYLQITKPGHGILLLSPAVIPTLSKEEQQDLDNYRKFMKGDAKP